MSGRRINWLWIALIALCAIGFWRGWLALTSEREPETEKVNIHLTVDPNKVRQDAEKVKEKTADLAGKAKSEAKELKRDLESKSKSSSK